MAHQSEIYTSRIITDEEYAFWNVALGFQCDIEHYDWSRAPQEIQELVNLVSSSYRLWVQSVHKTGSDPALFGIKDGQTYIIARWETNEYPLRTENQIMISQLRRIEDESTRDNMFFQIFFFLFEGMFTLFGILDFQRNDQLYQGVAFVTFALLLEVGRRYHKNRGLNRPCNIWEQKALKFIKEKHHA